MKLSTPARITSFTTLILLLLGSLLLAGCSSTKSVEGDERDAVLTYSEPASDGLFAGINQDDYTAFSADFDATMLSSMDQTAFEELRTSILTNLGAYVSREVSAVLAQGDYYLVVYTVQFEQEADVPVQVVYTKSEPHQVSGLWFKSDKLSSK